MQILPPSRAPMRSESPKSTPAVTRKSTAPNGGERTDVCAPARAPVRLADRRAKAVLGGSLGTNAKSSAFAEKVDFETGEITGGKAVHNPMMARIQRFILQSVARKFIPDSRINNCLRLRSRRPKNIFGFDQNAKIKVWQSIEHKTTSFSGLQTCGSVWACPVCSAKIAERRRAEIIAAMAAHKAVGGCVNMLTLTAPHQRADNLAELLAKQAVALKFFFKDGSAKNVLKEMGVVGQIRALEVTHGRLSDFNNGWHPHYHILQFAGVGVDLVRFDAVQMKDWSVRLYLRWAACCVRAGLGEPSFAHGLKLDDGSKAAKYVSKWGLEDEMTKGHTKKALHGETPFDFLRAYLVDSKDKQAGALFKEFAETFKGKRQLFWSPGLKKRYAIGESTDEELAAKMEDFAVMLGIITLEQWCDVLRVEGRGFVLQAAASGGWDAVKIYLASIQKSQDKIIELTDVKLMSKKTNREIEAEFEVIRADLIEKYEVLKTRKPLAIGAYSELFAITNNRRLTSFVLGKCTRNSRYLKALAEGGMRFHLDGTEFGEVSKEHQEDALKKIADRAEKEIQKKEAKKALKEAAKVPKTPKLPKTEKIKVNAPVVDVAKEVPKIIVKKRRTF